MFLKNYIKLFSGFHLCRPFCVGLDVWHAEVVGIPAKKCPTTPGRISGKRRFRLAANGARTGGIQTMCCLVISLLWHIALTFWWPLVNRVVRLALGVLYRRGWLFKEDLASPAAMDSPPSILSLRAWRLERYQLLTFFFSVLLPNHFLTPHPSLSYQIFLIFR